jgi:hypothetical protein
MKGKQAGAPILSGFVVVIAGWFWFTSAHVAAQCNSVLVQMANQQLCQMKTGEHAIAGFIGLAALVVFLAGLISVRRHNHRL